MNKTIGILAHVDAGKTTFAEQILYNTKSIRNRGRVDNKNAFLDNHNIERERGITIFSDQAIFEYNENTYYIIDTPGHVDFSTEMERAIEAMDYAIIIISAVEGIQSHSETVWDILRKYNIPTLFFINKIDRNGSSVEKVLEDISFKLTKNACFINSSINDFNIDESLIEFIAERDEELLEKYLEEIYDEKLWLSAMKKQIKQCLIFPCFSGSALQGIGINEFVEKLDLLTYTEYASDNNIKAKVYKIRYDEKGNKITYIKLLSGILKVKDVISKLENEKQLSDKINEIRLYNGDKYILKDEAYAGQLIGVTGLNNFKIGDGIGDLDKNTKCNIIPTLKSKVIFDSSINAKDLLKCFNRLEEEDPSLNVIWNEELHEMSISIMGKIQLEVIKELVKEKFDFNIEFGECEILYKESILNTVYGYGHFEPLRHYAEVNLKLECGEQGEGITFNNDCHVDDLSVGYQRLIASHIFEKDHKGILTGSKISDIRITLVNGRAHLKHTSGGDFREATYRALRNGLEQAENVLLEPFYKFKIIVSKDYIGRVISDIQRLNGTFETPQIIGDKNKIIGRGPVSTFMNYPLELIALTKGTGNINLTFGGYDKCHNSEEVIKKIGYKKNADKEYTSSSIFCSKGQGYTVEWKDVKSYMHCLK